jgi:ABC-2 type transport system ATP-binding protein
MSDAAIVVENVTKTYHPSRHPAVEALTGISFAVPRGSIFGLLGPNGAGKSTTVKILATLTRPDSGAARVAGIDVVREPERVRRAIGFVAQKQVSHPDDTGRENLVLAARLHGMSSRAAMRRADELLERFSLGEAADRLVKTYSGGMARKLDVALGLMHRPEVLFLDEPTTGLDPEARAEMWAELATMASDEAMTVLLTTHYLDEADHLARTIAIVDHGAVVASGTPESLKSELQGDAIAIELDRTADSHAALASASKVHGLREFAVEGHSLRGRADAGAATLPQLLAVLQSAGIPVASATVSRPSLDDVYLRYTGRTFAAADSAHSDGIAA